MDTGLIKLRREWKCKWSIGGAKEANVQTASCIHSCDYDPHSLIYRVVWTLGGLDRWRHFCVGSDYLDIWGNIDFDIYIRTKMNDDFMNYFQNYGIGITGGPTGKKRTTIDIMTFTWTWAMANAYA